MNTNIKTAIVATTTIVTAAVVFVLVRSNKPLMTDPLVMWQNQIELDAAIADADVDVDETETTVA